METPIEVDVGSVMPSLGWNDLIRPANPAAGVGFMRVIPGEAWERLRSIRFIYTASAVVATRFCFFQTRDQDGAVIHNQQITGGIAAGTTIEVNAAPGVTSALGTSVISCASIPDIVLRSRYQYGIAVLSMDAGDTITAITLHVRHIKSDFAHLEYEEWQQHYMGRQ